MDRFWFLTWTTYGTWLPGDDRGFVSNARDGEGPESRRNQPGTEPLAKQRGLLLSARSRLREEPLFLSSAHANLLLDQFHETAAHRGWTLFAVAIMRSHVHVVVGVNGDPEPEMLLRDFKNYGSRALNRHHPRPASGTWWTESGSRRKLPDQAAALATIGYVRNQEYPLVIWEHPKNRES